MHVFLDKVQQREEKIWVVVSVGRIEEGKVTDTSFCTSLLYPWLGESKMQGIGLKGGVKSLGGELPVL